MKIDSVTIKYKDLSVHIKGISISIIFAVTFVTTLIAVLTFDFSWLEFLNVASSLWDKHSDDLQKLLEPMMNSSIRYQELK